MTLRRNIVITGASSGLGEGMARQFAARGRNLALCARRTDRLESLAAELRHAYPQITVATGELDVNDHPQVFAVFEKFRDDLGTIDRVVINAGLGQGEPLGTGRFDANKLTVETNYVAAFAQAEAALDIFREENAGHLVFVSSIAGLRALPGHSEAYGSSKAAVAMLAQGLRTNLHATPITVTTLFPGFIRSEMTADMPDGPLLASPERGARALMKAIEREPARAYVPAFPYAPLSVVTRFAPTWLLRKLL